MTTTVTVTGSGCPVPSPDRAGPGVLIQSGELALQFDTGRSTVQRLAGAGLWPTDLDAVFLTHHHSDHVVGLADVVLTRWVMDRFDELAPLPIVAPEGPTAQFAEGVLHGWESDVTVRSEHSGRGTRPKVRVEAFAPQSRPTPVWEDARVTVLASAVRHEPVEGAVGYRIETPDGVIAISGDTRVCDEVGRLAESADVLVYEAMRFEPIESLPAHRRFILDYHADTRLIGRQAADLGVRTLVLTHLLPVPDGPDDVRAFVDDVRAAGFDGQVLVANDLDCVTLAR